ncbi:hypothetical protein BKA65DRAFT_568868 [Rhexocercosporidium sp. MPI-PUGE-AT-0058]|nr:hypothetical protein BKA65DRAFT_568868 [Rhexocercosporidium sp. MPI-PUGE-AT-0058]
MESPVYEKQNYHLEGEVPNTKVTFASLPIELRDKIWAATIEPRTITIYIHMLPMPVSDPHSELTDRPWFHTFTASIGPLRPRITLPQNPPQTPLELAVNDESPHFHLIDPDTTYKSPPAPVALHVCRTGTHHPAERLEHTLLRLGDIRRYATADAKKSFVKVEELIVYNRTEAVVGAIRKEPDQVRIELIQALKAAREKRGDLTFKLPEVIFEWDPYQLEQDMQLMENKIQEQARQRVVMAQRHSRMSVTINA